VTYSLCSKPNIKTNHASQARSQDHSGDTDWLTAYIVINNRHNDVEDGEAYEEAPISFH
jgi:hypothetical protein